MSEEMWHVEIEPGDVKVVTLEQMDDMYRLDIIQGTTKVWQEGMPRALPLSVVAGIDESEAKEEEEEIVELEPEILDSAPALDVSPPPPRSTITPPPASSVVVNQAPPAPPLPNPDFYSPQSLRPITMSGAPQAPAGTGTGGRIVMVLAVAAGLVLTLYRNDVLMAAAKSAGSESVYTKVESAVGQPGFGTTRSVEHLAALIEPLDVAAAPAALTTKTTQSQTSEATSDDTDSAGDKTREPARAKEEKADPSKSPTPTPAHATPRSVHKPAKKTLKRFKGSEYDPMNASL